MPFINKIAVHHSGGIASDTHASSAHLTFKDIDNAHRHRWNFPSEYIANSYGGYNVAYDPKTREFHQFRAVGEETAAQKGFNFDTFSICIIGNYTEGVDTLLPHTKIDVVNFLTDLCFGRHAGLVFAPGTTVSFHPSRIWPHRHFQQTECYGDAIEDNYFSKQVELRFYPQITMLQSLLVKLIELVKQLQAKAANMGKVDNRDCGC